MKQAILLLNMFVFVGKMQMRKAKQKIWNTKNTI